MGCVNGRWVWREESGLGREEEEEKKKRKRWSEGWALLMADGYGEKRVAWEEKRKRKKKKKKDGLKDERAVGNQ